ncbi:V-type proton ATPase subunit F isoform X1 [Myotis myotis]|uniref:V-type proton ATPase subunit F isoform X1 n=1 Tax=Myotis myotis TaxID=51298 RepID=UPI00174B77A0|nr:V-type proton ATPase subunit F isoform X1 [Myotis myotis]
MAGRGKLIAVIGDEDTVTGFLLGGIGELNKNRHPNFLVVEKDTTVNEIEDTFRSLQGRGHDAPLGARKRKLRDDRAPAKATYMMGERQGRPVSPAQTCLPPEPGPQSACAVPPACLGTSRCPERSGQHVKSRDPPLQVCPQLQAVSRGPELRRPLCFPSPLPWAPVLVPRSQEQSTPTCFALNSPVLSCQLGLVPVAWE